MTRLKAIAPEEASEKTRGLFKRIEAKFGMVPNTMRAMANSPALLEGYLNFSGALSSGKLGAKLAELIAVTVAQNNACDYCLSAHTFIGEKMAGLSLEALTAARSALADDEKGRASLRFANQLINTRGKVSDTDITTDLDAGFTEEELAELVGHVALNILTNYFNTCGSTREENSNP